MNAPLDTSKTILEFSERFVVSEECIRDNLEHLKLLDLKKKKPKKEIAKKKISARREEI